jgi:hypothetical protein
MQAELLPRTAGMCLADARGRQKKIDGPPRTLTTSPTHPSTIRLFFSTFLGVSRQGEFKNTIKIFLQKVHVENFFQNFGKKNR